METENIKREELKKLRSVSRIMIKYLISFKTKLIISLLVIATIYYCIVSNSIAGTKISDEGFPSITNKGIKLVITDHHFYNDKQKLLVSFHIRTNKLYKFNHLHPTLMENPEVIVKGEHIRGHIEAFSKESDNLYTGMFEASLPNKYSNRTPITFQTNTILSQTGQWAVVSK
ncbi:hypothetical protein GMB86_12645 [Terrilactibacillus sp. BCM23-1]|uniref:Uncharacterized protein n=1 Tax=Terrilactibacillus tamarindi TaxID=2599694 RepID=A0A6N8CRQ5_9BACI|nr:hypothetical protein [Terrilactibacillus tamarindi]MTT32854.1 hypothetical protein [Terrilactibacillus tamarindi]